MRNNEHVGKYRENGLIHRQPQDLVLTIDNEEIQIHCIERVGELKDWYLYQTEMPHVINENAVVKTLETYSWIECVQLNLSKARSKRQ
ncbi:hypothetical protein BDF14DRAFT_1997890 [Spinellus fusiger]|nr:hypothetical protein BDF14DRAFT_1997890 [Spinellus fusiger]